MENQLLARLTSDERQRLRPHFDEVKLSRGDQVIIPGAPIRYLYFPKGSLLSLITSMENGTAVESGTVGREGMSGIPVLLKAETTAMETLTQVPGEAVRVKAQVLQEEYDRGGNLHDILNRYMHLVVVTGSQSTACNALHRVEQRMCRWLLMSADGVGSDEVDLTQEYLSVMLGVRRPSVSETASEIQERGFIRYKRGHITILDRNGLKKMACECYARIKAEYERIFPA